MSSQPESDQPDSLINPEIEAEADLASDRVDPTDQIDQLIDEVKAYRSDKILEKRNTERRSQLNFGKKILDAFAFRAKAKWSEQELTNIRNEEELVSESEKEFVHGIIEASTQDDQYNRKQVNQMMDNRSFIEKKVRELQGKTVLGVSLGVAITVTSKLSIFGARSGARHLAEVAIGTAGSAVGAAVIGAAINGYRANQAESTKQYRASSETLLSEIRNIRAIEDLNIRQIELDAMERVVREKVSAGEMAEAIILQSSIDQLCRELIEQKANITSEDTETIPNAEPSADVMSEQANALYLEIIKTKNSAIKKATIRGVVKGAVLGGVIGATASIAQDYFSGNLAREIETPLDTSPAEEVASLPAEDILPEPLDPAEVILEHKADFIAEVAPGDGYTHLARKAIHDYLVNAKNLDGEVFSDLSPAERLYAEDHLRRVLQDQTHNTPLMRGDAPFSISTTSIQESINQARSLTDSQTDNLATNWAPRVSDRVWERLDLGEDQQDTFFYAGNKINLPQPDTETIISSGDDQPTTLPPQAGWIKWVGGGLLTAIGAASIAMTIHRLRKRKLESSLNNNSNPEDMSEEINPSDPTENIDSSATVDDSVGSSDIDIPEDLSSEPTTPNNEDTPQPTREETAPESEETNPTTEEEDSPVLDEPTTEPLLPKDTQPETDDENIETEPQLNLSVGAVSAAKLERINRNEDAYVWDPELNLAIVADGLGGHDKPREASQQACELIPAYLKTELDEHSTPTEAIESIKSAMIKTNQAIRETAIRENDLPGKLRGTTASLAKVCTNPTTGQTHAIIGHVGDSRVYEYNSSTQSLRPITLDTGLTFYHTAETSIGDKTQKSIDLSRPRSAEEAREMQSNLSRIQNESDINTLSEAEQLAWKNRHKVASCLGVSEAITPQIYDIPLSPDSILILASDGLTDNLPDPILESLMNTFTQQEDYSLQEIAEKINQRGFNISHPRSGRKLLRSKEDDITVMMVGLNRTEATKTTTETSTDKPIELTPAELSQVETALGYIETLHELSDKTNLGSAGLGGQARIIRALVDLFDSHPQRDKLLTAINQQTQTNVELQTFIKEDIEPRLNKASL